MLNLLKKNIEEIIEEKGLTQLQVAQNAELDPTVLSRFLNKGEDVLISTIYKIAKGLGVHPWELFVDKNKVETWPLNKEEQAFISDLRRVASDTDRKTIKDVLDLTPKK